MGDEGIDKLKDVDDAFSSRSKSEGVRGGKVIIAGDVIERVKMAGRVVNNPPAPLSAAAQLAS